MFNLSLTKKLALAAAAFPAFAFIYWFVEDVWPRTEGDPPDSFAKVAFGSLIGVFVLVPQIKSKTWSIGRILTLIVAPVIVGTLIDLLDSTLILQRLHFMNNFNASMVAYWVLFSIMIAATTVSVSPLKVQPRFWVMVGTSGLLFGLGLVIYAEFFFRLFGSPAISGFDWIILPIGLLYPMMISLSFHFGAADNTQS